MINFLFNNDFYNMFDRTEKDLAVRSIDSKIFWHNFEIGTLSGFLIDFKYINSGNEDTIEEFTLKEIIEDFEDYGLIDLFNEKYRDNISKDELKDDIGYEEYKKKFFTDYDFDDFLNNYDLQFLYDYENSVRYVVLIRNINLDELKELIHENQVIKLLADNLKKFIDIEDYVILNINNEVLFEDRN